MLKKKLTLMLIPSSEGSPRQFRLSYGFILTIFAGLFLIIATSLLISSLFFNNQVNETELAQLKAENAKLHEKYEQMRWNLSEVESRYSDLVEREIKIRSLFDLPAIDPAERQLGVGGPAPLNYNNMSETEQFAVNTELEIDRLLRLSDYELEKYSEVEEALTNVKTRLQHTPSIWPTNGWNSRGYGMKYDPFTGYKQMHRGIDIANNTGTPIIATADGKIEKTATSSGMGKYITVNHGYGFKTRYGHLSKILVKRGQKVKRGDVIAYMGSTGYSTGPHLHYEVIRNGKFLDPRKFILNKKTN